MVPYFSHSLTFARYNKGLTSSVVQRAALIFSFVYSKVEQQFFFHCNNLISISKKVHT